MTTQPCWRILGPIDAEERDGGEAAIRFAEDFAREAAGELTLLNVVDPDRSDAAQPDSLSEHTARGSRSIVFPGQLPATIHQYADFMNADLMLMTAQGRNWRRLFRPSVSDQVLRYSDRPVLAVDPARFQTQRAVMRSILCVVDLQGTDGPVIEFASRIAEQTGAEITLLHVLPEIHEGTIAAPSDRPLTESVALDRIRRMELPGRYRTLILTGSQVSTIVEGARQIHADLVVTGRPMPHARRLVRPDVRALVGKLSCPVVSVPMGASTPRRRFVLPQVAEADTVPAIVRQYRTGT